MTGSRVAAAAAGAPPIWLGVSPELLLRVPCGSADGLLDGVQGVRVLGRGCEVLVPRGRYGSFAAAWGTAPGPDDSLLDPAALRDGLGQVDKDTDVGGAVGGNAVVRFQGQH
ncbi:hypothetical protein ACFYRL_34170 [Streptomyces goshikiensis]|uniref:hypothetical protein n=1 Tax=Streptomyces goshikiensis TaxID=1942 RepID=UPI0036A203CA